MQQPNVVKLISTGNKPFQTKLATFSKRGSFNVIPGFTQRWRQSKLRHDALNDSPHRNLAAGLDRQACERAAKTQYKKKQQKKPHYNSRNEGRKTCIFFASRFFKNVLGREPCSGRARPELLLL